jgi:hypothetical protein
MQWLVDMPKLMQTCLAHDPPRHFCPKSQMLERGRLIEGKQKESAFAGPGPIQIPMPFVHFTVQGQMSGFQTFRQFRQIYVQAFLHVHIQTQVDGDSVLTSDSCHSVIVKLTSSMKLPRLLTFLLNRYSPLKLANGSANSQSLS